MRLRKMYLANHMIGDCDNCGHSIMYHLPLAGCIKGCGCEEFS